MIPALVIGVLVGGIVGWAISAWRHAATIAPPPSTDIGFIGLGAGSGDHYVDAYTARMLKPIIEKMGWEVKL